MTHWRWHSSVLPPGGEALCRLQKCYSVGHPPYCGASTCPPSTLVSWLHAGVPKHLGSRDQFCGRWFFHGWWGEMNGFRMIQVHYIYCALYFYYYYISSTSDHEALDSRGWGCLLQSQSVSSVAQSCLTLATPWTAACQASLSITNSRSLLKRMSIESVTPSNHLILSHALE